ncbi:MAG: helix-turn-helix transcriptional regulator [Candidatus Omnitrophica bacterium]|nr:helix-turn-helix transcriptional regulator [Candidatus Omnitrophota bacterium]
MILLWRNEKNLTQSEVARRSGVSRPNLSAIEQGTRDVTVGTLRCIAAALGTNPGALVDGIGPTPVLSKEKLGRRRLDRIARLVAGQKLRASASEQRLALDLASIMKFKTHPLTSTTSTGKINSTRAENATVLRLKSELGVVLFEHLVKRVEKNLISKLIPHE